jgi:hypothetical protein
MFFITLPLGIAVAQIILAVASLYYLYWKLRHDRRFPLLSFFSPLSVFVALNILSAFFSIQPSISFLHLKGLVLFILIPLFYDSVRTRREIVVVHAALFLSGMVSCAKGLYQFFTVRGELVTNRITGFLGHWMTFSGILMLLTVLMFSYLLFAKKKSPWLYLAFGIYCFTLLLSLTRSAWLGVLTASLVLVLLKKPGWFFAVPGAALAIFVASLWILPSAVSERIRNTFNPVEVSNHERLEMLKSGTRIIQDHPFTGTGGGIIRFIYPQYRSPSSKQLTTSHLHK